MINLMLHQEEGVDFAVGRKKSIIAHGMRLGKTLLAIAYALRIEGFPATVICPASLRWVWAEQINQWAPRLKVQVLTEGTDKFKRGADFHIVSFEYITKTMRIPISKMKLLIVDEAHYLKTLEAKRTQRIWALIDIVPRVLMLSGTIVPNRPVELYTILRMVGAINMDYTNYTKHFCAAHPTEWGMDVNGASNIDELNWILEPFMHYRTKEMVIEDLPEVGRQVIALNLPINQREKGFNLDELENAEEAIAFEGLTDLMVFIGEQKAAETINFVKDLLTKTNKVVVFFQYHSTADLLQEGLAQYGAVRYDGKTRDKKRIQARKRFQEDENCRIIIIQIRTAVGIPLWAADTTVFAEASWVPGDLAQAEARVDIIHGVPQKTFHYYMTVHKSIDEHQLRRTLEKKAIIDQIVKPTDPADEFM